MGSAHVSGWSAALEASTRPGSVAVLAGGALRESLLDGDRAHAADLLPALAGLARAAGAQPRDLDCVYVGTGPGSFTGLRVAAALAQGLARGGSARIAGVPSLEALCYRELAPGEEAAVLLDARAGELYFARYRRTEDDVAVLDEPRVLRPADVSAALPPGARVLGDERVARAARLAPDVVARLTTGSVPRAAALLELAASRVQRGTLAPQVGHRVRPLYLRGYRTTQRA